MTPWPDMTNTAANSYLEIFQRRTAATQATYRDTLRDFEAFVQKHCSGQFLSQKIIQAWLRDSAERSCRSSVIARACIINRFLDWLVVNRRLKANPFAELRHRYGLRTTAPIVRALLSTNTKDALEKNRPLPRFASHLGSLMQSHIRRMQAMGFRYRNVEGRMLAFDRYLQSHQAASSQPLNGLVHEYAGLASTPTEKLQRIKLGRLLAKSLRRSDPTVVPLPLDRRLIRQSADQRRQPHVYSMMEVQQLLETARNYPSPYARLRPHTLYAILALAYCTGLRRSELAHLTLQDVDLEEASIDIQQSKFFKSRRLPLTESVAGVIKDYLDARKHAGAPTGPQAPLFWNERGECGYSPSAISKLLVAVIRRAGLKPGSGRAGPCIHDLRRTFIVHRMTLWYQAGINPQSRLPYLATYLGHKDIRSTLIYLTMSVDLLQKASDRFHCFGIKALQDNPGGDA